MNYYSILGLQKEPFSTSPDPNFLYRSKSHISALYKLEIAIRLRRGLCLLLGDVGTGKTTIARALIQSFKNEPSFIFHIILDPYHETRFEFISNLCRVLELNYTELSGPEVIEKYLFQKGVSEAKTVVIIIDEGQKLSQAGIEVLRTLLNYETNEFKLLQLIIMAQVEFLLNIGKMRNFMDRIAFKYFLNPLNENETKEMIEYRLSQAGFKGGHSIFTDQAIHEIYSYTKGYPRKITYMCHNALERAVMYDKTCIDVDLIESIIREESKIIQAHQFIHSIPPFNRHIDSQNEQKIININ